MNTFKYLTHFYIILQEYSKFKNPVLTLKILQHSLYQNSILLPYDLQNIFNYYSAIFMKQLTLVFMLLPFILCSIITPLNDINWPFLSCEDGDFQILKFSWS